MIFLLFVLFLSSFSGAQEPVTFDLMAEDYYKRGEFKKALISYEKLLKEKPYSFKYVYRLIDIYQQLENYEEAQSFITEKMIRFRSPALLVELGYNYQLQDSSEQAQLHYEEAISTLDENPNFVYSITKRFETHSLLEEAIRAYTKATGLLPDKNFNIQLARIYGEQGDIENMFNNYLDYIYFQPNFMNNAKRAFNDFITDDAANENNLLLRRLLLKKIQQQPDLYWYELLSWLYVQQYDYGKSFVQEKAIYKRNPSSLERLFELAIFALEDKNEATAEEIFGFILESAQDIETQLSAHQYILELSAAKANTIELEKVKTRYLELFDSYGRYESTVSLQISYGEFLAFYRNAPEEAADLLKQTLKLNLSPYQEGLVKLKLGDFLVLQERFNEALIYFSQIQTNLKNSTLSQEARFKVAKTSYYKGDFDWAESQLKILKSSTSQLIANDALDLKLMISDNKYEDSTRTALRLYAKADLLAFQKQPDSAVEVLDQIMADHKGESIIDEALYKQAKLYEELGRIEAAANNYQRIIDDYREDILADDAYFGLAELYRNQLNRPEDAKALYEKIIFEHEDSIYFVEARKHYRRLRGDQIE